MIMINCSNNISRVILGECRMVIKKVGVRRMGRKIVVWLKEVIIVIIRIILWSIFRMMCLISVCRRYCFVRIVYSLRLSIAILLLVRKFTKVYRCIKGVTCQETYIVTKVRSFIRCKSNRIFLESIIKYSNSSINFNSSIQVRIRMFLLSCYKKEWILIYTTIVSKNWRKIQILFCLSFRPISPGSWTGGIWHSKFTMILRKNS